MYRPELACEISTHCDIIVPSPQESGVGYVQAASLTRAILSTLSVCWQWTYATDQNGRACLIISVCAWGTKPRNAAYAYMMSRFAGPPRLAITLQHCWLCIFIQSYGALRLRYFCQDQDYTHWTSHTLLWCLDQICDHECLCSPLPLGFAQRRLCLNVHCNLYKGHFECQKSMETPIRRSSIHQTFD